MTHAVPDDFLGNSSTTGRLVVGTPLAGRFEHMYDSDWVKVDLTAGTAYVLSMPPLTAGLGGSEPFNSVELNLRGPDGAILWDESGFRYLGPAFEYTPKVSGTYYLEARTWDAEDFQLVNYTLSASLKPAVSDDFPTNATTSGVLLTAGKAGGNFEFAGDIDWFMFRGEAGKNYSFGSETAAPFVEVAGMRIFDSAGVEHPIYNFNPAVTADYFIAVGSYRAGPYSIVSRPLPTDDYAEDMGTTGVLRAGTDISGGIQFRFDTDYIKSTLVGGVPYTFELGASASEISLLSLTLRNAAGADVPIGIYPSEVGKALLKFTPSASGDYYFVIHGEQLFNGVTRSPYTLKWATDTSADISAPVLASQWLPNGAINASLTADIVLTFNESIKVAGNAIRLRDAAGIEVALDYAGQGQSSLAIGNRLVIDPALTLRPGTSYTLETPAGSILDHAGNPYTGVKSFTFTTKVIASTGSAGNDLLAGSGSGISITGGGGVDTVIYAEAIANYRVARNNGDATVWHGAAPAGDSLSGVERLLFADGTIALDINGTAGMAYRLYQAAFDRVPDKDGLGYWIAQMDSGMTLSQAAGNFVSSDEFKSLYGTGPTNAQFVDLLYDNVLHRKGDQAGIDFWLNSLAVGVKRDDMLASFSESAENQAALVAIIGNGFVYNPYG